ncbi:XRE family transcriptional regulator [Natrialba hulunbeirensis JCM 10989]|uniref:XRE family transcriptional regulator n=1 Tax=Natrialba hulunbeirensis JCM 10989 TaxID=1227493 RepID=L9ZT16_9EURY|nr:helix-turn-helix transcriptional regulator [Natrialba hulunbeirensis]ELY89489.1 XRE family transcriptional regulator [Natrialba hulunbeirensis JCM 10989]
MENHLTERREEAGLSQGDLAAAVDVTRQTINAIERERYDPSLELAFKLAAFFECHIEELFEPDFDRESASVSELDLTSE